jgi:hypothetical protein
MKEHKIQKVIKRRAMNNYSCQCNQDGCSEIVEKGEEYALFKVVILQHGEYKNREQKVSFKCAWFEKWREFLGL